MAFGQSSGPPATGKQIRELEELLEAAGHSGFRDARGPMGFTQRQAGGKFTRDEADAFIEQLRHEAEGGANADAAPEPAPRAPRAAPARTPSPRGAMPPVRTSKAELALREASDELLAAELQRRGWIVVEP